MADEPAFVEVDTVALCRQLGTGAFACAPLAEPGRVSFGPRGEALLRLERFLERHLVTAPTRIIARYGLPHGIELVEVTVPLVRRELPRRLQRELRLAFRCVIVPQGRDRWVMIPALAHTFYLERNDDVQAAVASEVQRLTAARELADHDALRLFPAVHEELVPLTVMLAHEGLGLAGRARAIKKTRLLEERRRQALELLTTVATPVKGPESPPVGHDAELTQLLALLNSPERGSVLLIGDEGVGKGALVRAYAAHPEHARSVYATSSAQLVAGMSGFGEWQERVTQVMLAAELLDAVIYFESLAELFGDRVEQGGVDIAGTLRRYVVGGRARVVGELRPDELDAASRRQPALLGAMSQLRVEPLSPGETLRALTVRAGGWARREGPRLDEGAASAIVDLAERYLPYRAFPGKAVAVLEELRAAGKEGEPPGARGVPAGIGTEQVYGAFAVLSGIPAFLLRPEQPFRAEQIVEQLRRRVIGQEEAVRRVAETLNIVKARLQPAGKPLCTLLFVGPTGVGKTEVARALTALLFGDDDRMARFDMSEYADPYAAERLIRGTHFEGGVLTTKVREQPFSLLLLDEIEKAHPAVFDLLLQVIGEGRLTDARGRTTFFHNAIVILTSNLGAGADRAPLGLGARPSPPAERYVRAVHESFRPELVNRLDRIVVFQPLDAPELEDVARIAIARIAERRGLSAEGVVLEVSPAARLELARGGQDERYGVRALRRHLEKALVVPVARALSRLGAEARGAAVWVRLANEDENDAPYGRKSRIAAVDSGLLRIEIHRRPAAGGRRTLAGIEAIAEVRRYVDFLMSSDEVVSVLEQLQLFRADLATARSKKGNAPDDLEALSRMHHRVARVVERVEAVRGDLRAAEQLCLTALYEGEPVEEWAAEAGGTRRAFDVAILELLLSTRAMRDEVTVALFEPDGPGPMDLWLGQLFRAAESRSWHLVLHVRASGPHGEGWPRERSWSPPRDVAWARAHILGGSHRSVLLRARGRDAGLFIALEAGIHRIHGVGGASNPRHLEVRLGAMRTELTDKSWYYRPLEEMPAPPRRGVVAARERALDGAEVKIDRERVALVPSADYWDRIEEVLLQHLLFQFDEGNAEDVWRGVLDTPDVADPVVEDDP